MSAAAVIHEPALALADIVECLTTAAVPYFLVGSFASGVRGEFRATNDIDIVCKLNDSSVRLLAEFAQRKFHCDELAALAAVHEGRSFNLIHITTVVKIDIFTKLSELEELEFTRATEVLIPDTDRTVKVSSAEYNVIAKLRWFKLSGFQLERQLFDVRSILAVNQHLLDYSYIEIWTKKFGVSEIYQSLMNSRQSD